MSEETEPEQGHDFSSGDSPSRESASGSKRQAQSQQHSGMDAGYARFAGLGIHFAVTILVFAYGGYRLDLWLDSSPWFLLVGVFAGFGGGMISLISRVKQVTVDRKPAAKAEEQAGKAPDRSKPDRPA